MALQFAKVKRISLIRGTRWQDEVQLVEESTGEPVDLTGVEDLVMTVRRRASGPAVFELALGNGLAIVNAAQGLIEFDVSSERTLEFPDNGYRRMRYVYDALIVRSDGEREPAFSGTLTVSPSHTRPWEST